MTSSTMAARLIITILGVTFFCMVQNHPHAETCAESCSCTPEDTDWSSAVNVQCGERNLRSVPNKTNDQQVSLFNVSFNALMTLEADALQSYESVRSLYLQHCKIVNINEKAFQRLENLTKLDLSSNSLTSISPNLFNGNKKLDTLILRRNDLGTLQWNTPILNGSSSLSFLDLQSCQLSNISSITFSLLYNLTILDISRNNLVLLNNDSLYSHKNLKDVNLENNPWQCGAVFQGLLCWMHSNPALSHNRTVKCQYRNGTREIWSPKNRSSCDSDSTLSVISSHKPGISASTKLNLANYSSHKLDIPTSTTLNTKVSHKVEPGTNIALVIFWATVVGFVSLISAVLFVLYLFSKQYHDYEPVRPNCDKYLCIGIVVV